MISTSWAGFHLTGKKHIYFNNSLRHFFSHALKYKYSNNLLIGKKYQFFCKVFFWI